MHCSENIKLARSSCIASALYVRPRCGAITHHACFAEYRHVKQEHGTCRQRRPARGQQIRTLHIALSDVQSGFQFAQLRIIFACVLCVIVHLHLNMCVVCSCGKGIMCEIMYVCVCVCVCVCVSGYVFIKKENAHAHAYKKPAMKNLRIRILFLLQNKKICICISP